MKRLNKIAYKGKYTNEQLEDLKNSYESVNNEHKDLSFEDWISEIENLGLINDMLDSFTSEQMLSILDKHNGDEIMKIYDDTTGESLEGPVKSLIDWIKNTSLKFDLKLHF